MQNEKRIYFAVKALIILDGKFLAMHKKNEPEDILELPGGRMEFGESSEETLVREIKEETGLTIEQLKIIDTWNYVGDNYQITGIICLCRIVNGSIRLSDEHDRYEWLNHDTTSIDKMHNAFKKRMIKWDWEEIISSCK